MKDEDGTSEAKDDVAFKRRRINLDCVGEMPQRVYGKGNGTHIRTNWYSKRGKSVSREFLNMLCSRNVQIVLRAVDFSSPTPLENLG